MMVDVEFEFSHTLPDHLHYMPWFGLRGYMELFAGTS